MAEYRYYIEDSEVFPLNAGTETYSFDKKSDDNVNVEKSLESELFFSYSSSGFDFKAQELNNKCQELVFSTYKKCGTSYYLEWEGVFSVAEGKFDDDQCVFAIKIRVKESLLDDIQVNIFDNPDRIYEGGVFGITTGLTTATRIYANAIYFDSLILFVAQRSNPKIVKIISNYFQINPTIISSDVLPGVTNYFTKMAFCSLSDVQEPIPSGLTSREFISFSELMADLFVIFGVEWKIDSDYNLIIEHSTAFLGGTGLDLTQEKYSKHLTASNKYSYDLKDYPKKETWKIAGHHNVSSLIYSGLSNVGKANGEKSYNTNKIRTGFKEIRYDNEGSTSDGLFLFATDGGTGAGYWRMLESNNQNYRLDPKFLVVNIHTYNRPSIYSLYTTINRKYESQHESGGLELNSIRPTLTQEISIPLCCEDTFDQTKTVTTELGDGYIQKAKFNVKSNQLDITLKYKTSNCNDFNPADLEDKALWLPFQTGITMGSVPPGSVTTVSQWDDASGNGRHATQATLANRPQIINDPTSPILFLASFGVPTSLYLTTPSFQLFPNKRGTIIFLLGQAYGGIFGGGSGVGASGTMSIVSTHNGGAGTYFDASLNSSQFHSFTEGAAYPQNIASPTFPHGLFVIKRPADTRIYTYQSGLAAKTNPMIISNSQPTSEPLIIGSNLVNIPTEAGTFFLYELFVFDRDLSDREIETLQFYLLKKGIYKIYPDN